MKPKKTIHVESAWPSRDNFETLSLANKYMLSIEKMGSEFRLPREHVRVQTLLEDSSNGRITQALREELLAEFWKQIDDEIKNGEVLKL